MDRVLTQLYDANDDARPEAYRMRQNPRDPRTFLPTLADVTDATQLFRDAELTVRVVGTEEDVLYANFRPVRKPALSTRDALAQQRLLVEVRPDARDASFAQRLRELVRLLGPYSCKLTLATRRVVVERVVPRDLGAAATPTRTPFVPTPKDYVANPSRVYPGVVARARAVNYVMVGYRLLPTLLRHRTPHLAALTNWYELLSYPGVARPTPWPDLPGSATDMHARPRMYYTNPATTATAARIGVRAAGAADAAFARWNDRRLANRLLEGVREPRLALEVRAGQPAFVVEQAILREGTRATLQGYLAYAAQRNQTQATTLAAILFQVAQALRAAYLDCRFVHQGLTTAAIDLADNPDAADAGRPFVYVDRRVSGDPVPDAVARPTHAELDPMPAALVQNAYTNELALRAQPRLFEDPADPANWRVSNVQLYRVPAVFVAKVHAYGDATVRTPRAADGSWTTVGLGALGAPSGGSAYAPDPSLDLRTLAWDLLTTWGLLPSRFWHPDTLADLDAAERDARWRLADFLFRAAGGPTMFAHLVAQADALEAAEEAGDGVAAGAQLRLRRQPMRALLQHARAIVDRVQVAQPGVSPLNASAWRSIDALAGAHALQRTLADFYAGKRTGTKDRPWRSEPTSFYELRREYVEHNYVLTPRTRAFARQSYTGLSPHTALAHPLFDAFAVSRRAGPALLQKLQQRPEWLVGLPPIPTSGSLRTRRPQPAPWDAVDDDDDAGATGGAGPASKRPRFPGSTSAGSTQPPKRARTSVNARLVALAVHHHAQQAAAAARHTDDATGPTAEPACAHCRAFAGVYRCGGCRDVHYCSAECQHAAWTTGHRVQCRDTRR